MNQCSSPLPLLELLRPTDRAGVADAVRRAGRAATPLYPIGGGTNLGYGVRPAEPGLGLSLSGLNRFVDYPARDLTITVEAGVTIAALAKRLAGEGQRLPIDVAYPDRATVGGVVAASCPGPRHYRWGTIRDYVIGASAVDGCGREFSSGGRVVKNAAGYDLCRLLTGSFGALAVMTQVTLMVKPLPETSALLACDAANLDAAEKLLAGLVHTRVLPSAIELLAGPAWRNDSLLGSLPPGASVRLAVGLEGTAAEVEWMVHRLQDEWRQAAVAATVTLRGLRADPLWERLTEFPTETGNGHGETPIVIQINVLPGAVVEAVRSVLDADPQASILAHAGGGVIYARLRLKTAEAAAVLDERLRPAVSPSGSLVVLRQPEGLALGPHTVWGPPRPAHAAMQAIKNEFDPQGILNRGRLLYCKTATMGRASPTTTARRAANQ